jgi:hypothetical protein
VIGFHVVQIGFCFNIFILNVDVLENKIDDSKGSFSEEME